MPKDNSFIFYSDIGPIAVCIARVATNQGLQQFLCQEFILLDRAIGDVNKDERYIRRAYDECLVARELYETATRNRC